PGRSARPLLKCSRLLTSCHRRHLRKGSLGRINGKKINQGARMLKLIAISTGFCLALAVSVPAAEPGEEAAAKKPVQKSKPVQKQQQIAPTQHTAPNAHVQTLHTERAN